MGLCVSAAAAFGGRKWAGSGYVSTVSTCLWGMEEFNQEAEQTENFLGQERQQHFGIK